MTTQLTITKPDDWHLHLRDGPALNTTVAFSARQFQRAIVMPNLAQPIVNAERASAYRQRILDALPEKSSFQPLMTIYLTNDTSIEDIKQASQSDYIFAAKLYPAGATTNSSNGVADVSALFPVLEEMQKHDLPLLVHAEVTDTDIDIFDREKAFIDKYLTSIRKTFPELRIVLEHATTQQSVDFVLENNYTAATLTPQHLLFNRNDLLAGGIRPHNYCLPILKRETHRQALIKAATSGNPKFFLGTDSAPHATTAKENQCGCAGCFTAYAAIELYAEAFEKEGALNKLEGFSSFYGPDFYRLPRNKQTLTLSKESWQAPPSYSFGTQTLTPFRQETPLQWKIK
ncbi:MAG: dihydroorotase [Cycloclasticus pugetii]|jgi:dihydroorotase|uniref:Dihydroorotase n=1 Tax=Cycloclasticus zancles 78-ME TaxID=1198232 RepID=S5TAR4_9GAMM|nr:dihydroorotase [Cycloclasticus zancles]AGS40689.1 Dihydroorotase [Cycloclasticus zancles 78-ME]